MIASVYHKIRNEYEKRRKHAFDVLERRKAELYEKYPRLKEIDDEIHYAGIKYNKLILTGAMTPDDAARELSDIVERLKNERIEILTAGGYSPNYLQPAYTCEKCFDTGIIRAADGGADTTCICYRQQLINYLYDQSNLSVKNIDGFESFITDYYPEIADENKYGIKISPRKQILWILKNCREFVDKFSDPETRNLLFCGPTGVGKTYMSGCIAVELMKRGRVVLYQSAPALFNAIYEYRYNKADDSEWESSVYSSIMEADLLIIDDLGTESPTGMRYSELLNIIDTRLSNDAKRPCKTIICTNIDLKELFEYYDERIVSRIIGGFDIYRFAGDDLRRLKKT